MGEQEVDGVDFSSSLSVMTYWLLWNFYVNTKVRLLLVISLGSAHWLSCYHGESVAWPNK